MIIDYKTIAQTLLYYWPFSTFNIFVIVYRGSYKKKLVKVFFLIKEPKDTLSFMSESLKGERGLVKWLSG